MTQNANFSFHLVRAKHNKMPNRFYPNLALPTLASVLKDKCMVEIHDIGSDKNSYVEHVKETKPNVIGFTSYMDDFGEVLTLASECKKVSEKTFVVVGGPHASIVGDSIKAMSKSIDLLVVGEGELAIMNLCNELETRSASYSDKPAVLRSNNFYDMRFALPPSWDLYDRTPFFQILPVETSRGCVYACKYCGEGKMYGITVRAKSKEQVIRELKINIERYETRFFRFTDSTFNFTKKRFEEICRAFIDVKLGIHWSAYVRFETIEKNMLALAKDAGCEALFFGVESGSDAIFKPMRKSKVNAKYIQEILAAARETGLHTHCNFIVGLPDETIQTTNETIQLIKEINPESVQISTFFVVPQTEVHIHAERYGIEFTDPEWISNLHRFFGDPYYSYFRHKTMTQNDMRVSYAAMKNEVDKIDSIFWNLQDHFLLSWLSAGGSEAGLKKVWNKPEKYLNKIELEQFEIFKGIKNTDVEDGENGIKNIKELAVKLG